MKTKIFLVIISMIIGFTTNAQMNEDFTNSKVCKSMLKVNTKTKKAASIEEATKMMNSGVNDVLLYDTIKLVFCRFLILENARLVKIVNEIPSNNFSFISTYFDKTRVEAEKLIECTIDQNGKVLILSTEQKMDPKGKDGAVYPDSLLTNSMPFTVNGKAPISDKDPIVIRYQKEIDALLKSF
jgi:hypothetical protein